MTYQFVLARLHGVWSPKPSCDSMNLQWFAFSVVHCVGNKFQKSQCSGVVQRCQCSWKR